MEHRIDTPFDVVRCLKQAGTSNELLSVHDSHIVRELLSDANSKFEILDRKILEDPSSSWLLSKRRGLLLERIERYRIALAPHKILPHELLNYIFLLALDRGISLPLRRHSSFMPWSISYVCSRWRQIALAEPRLWANVAIDYFANNHSKLNSIGNEILLRSRDYGISLLCTEEVSILEDYAPEALTTQRELITTYAPQLVHLTIESTKTALIPYLETPPLQFTSLESITMSIRGRFHFNDFFADRPLTLFSNAPSLRKITLNAFLQYQLLPELLLVPWGQITDLVLRQVVIQHDVTLALLQQCTNLTNCTLTLGDIPDPVLAKSPNDATPITIQRLRSLTLQIGIKIMAIHLLGSISLPSLQALDIGPNTRTGGIPQGLPQDAILLMLKRSCCKLETFTCRYRNEFDVSRVLKDMPELRSFSLTARYLGNSEIEAMSRGELLLKLEHIHCGLKAIHPFLDYLENSWSTTNRSSGDAYKGLMSVNVWGYGLADRGGAQARIDKLKHQIELEKRTVSIVLADG